MTRSASAEKLRRSADARAPVFARRFGDSLRVGDGMEADRVVDDALVAGMAADAVQSLVVEPAMVRIGELWESQHIGVADEHLATSISQRSLIRLFEALSAGRPRLAVRTRVLLAAVEGQHHVLGLRMIADVLEGAGYDVLYLGENVPVASLREFVAQHRPSVAGLAFGIASEIRFLADSLWAIHEIAPETRIMLGGRAIPTGLQDAGYPCVVNSMEVVGAVEALLAGPPQPVPATIDLLRSGDAGQSWPREHAAEEDAVAGRLAQAADEAVDLARTHVRRAETYRDLAFRDPLTEMANRRAFEEALSANAGKSGGTGMVLMIDVDSFKAVNDEHGHQLGDQLLCAVGHSISESVRRGDLAARFGGDEFAALLPGASEEVAREIAERIRRAVAAGSSPAVTVSVGIAELAGNVRGALLAADIALYEAKAAGRDRVAG